MKRSRFSDEQVLKAVQELAAGRSAAEVGRELGVSVHTVYAWNKKFGGLQVDEARRLRQLESENQQLRNVVANLTLDKEALKALIAKNGWGS